MMNVENIDAFPTLIQKVAGFLTQNQCDEISQYINSFDMSEHGLFEGNAGSSYSIDSDILGDISNKLDSCTLLKQQVDSMLVEYMKASGILHIVIDRSWSNIQGIGSKLIKHSHPGSFITGALYINVDENSSPLEIYNPNPFIHHTAVEHKTIYTNDILSLPPINGDLVIFPSWLLHGAMKENNTSKRIIISFNSGIGK